MDRFERLAAAAIVAMAVSLAAAPAAADEVDAAMTMAMEHYELGETEVARTRLEGALDALAGAGEARSPRAARVHVLLGVVHVRRNDEAAAVEHFERGQAIDSTVALPPEYTNEATSAQFAAATAQLAATRQAAADAARVDCATLAGIKHEIVDAADVGQPKRIACHVGPNMGVTTVSLFYRIGGRGEYAEVPMTGAAGAAECEYAGEVPADAVAVGTLQYYIAAKTAEDRLVAGKGSAQSPFIVEVRAATAIETSSGIGGEATEEEIPDHLRGPQPEAPRSGGCAGCDLGDSGRSTPAGWLFLVLGVAVVARRRRPRPLR